MVTFTQTKAPLSLSEIEEIEKYVGLTFPQTYKEHLLKYNGGQCHPNIFSFIEKGKATDSCVDWFFAIYDGEYNNLKKEIRMVKIDEKRMPIHMLPFAHDPLGNLICISCYGTDIGKIYFWDHENEVDYSIADDSDYSNLYPIAENLKDFFSSLKENFG